MNESLMNPGNRIAAVAFEFLSATYIQERYFQDNHITVETLLPILEDIIKIFNQLIQDKQKNFIELYEAYQGRDLLEDEKIVIKNIEEINKSDTILPVPYKELLRSYKEHVQREGLSEKEKSILAVVQTLAKNQALEISIMCKKITGEPLTPIEENYKKKLSAQLNVLQEIYNGLWYSAGASCLINLCSSLYATVIHGLIDHIPAVVLYVAGPFIGPMVIKSAIKGILDKTPLSEKHKAFLMPWANTFFRLLMDAYFLKVSVGENWELIYQYPNSKGYHEEKYYKDPNYNGLKPYKGSSSTYSKKSIQKNQIVVNTKDTKPEEITSFNVPVNSNLTMDLTDHSEVVEIKNLNSITVSPQIFLSVTGTGKGLHKLSSRDVSGFEKVPLSDGTNVYMQTERVLFKSMQDNMHLAQIFDQKKALLIHCFEKIRKGETGIDADIFETLLQQGIYIRLRLRRPEEDKQNTLAFFLLNEKTQQYEFYVDIDPTLKKERLTEIYILTILGNELRHMTVYWMNTGKVLGNPYNVGKDSSSDFMPCLNKEKDDIELSFWKAWVASIEAFHERMLELKKVIETGKYPKKNKQKIKDIMNAINEKGYVPLVYEMVLSEQDFINLHVLYEEMTGAKLDLSRASNTHRIKIPQKIITQEQADFYIVADAEQRMGQWYIPYTYAKDDSSYEDFKGWVLDYFRAISVYKGAFGDNSYNDKGTLQDKITITIEWDSTVSQFTILFPKAPHLLSPEREAHDKQYRNLHQRETIKRKGKQEEQSHPETNPVIEIQVDETKKPSSEQNLYGFKNDEFGMMLFSPKEYTGEPSFITFKRMPELSKIVKADPKARDKYGQVKTYVKEILEEIETNPEKYGFYPEAIKLLFEQGINVTFLDASDIVNDKHRFDPQSRRLLGQHMITGVGGFFYSPHNTIYFNLPRDFSSAELNKARVERIVLNEMSHFYTYFINAKRGVKPFLDAKGKVDVEKFNKFKAVVDDMLKMIYLAIDYYQGKQLPPEVTSEEISAIKDFLDDISKNYTPVIYKWIIRKDEVDKFCANNARYTGVQCTLEDLEATTPENTLLISKNAFPYAESYPENVLVQGIINGTGTSPDGKEKIDMLVIRYTYGVIDRVKAFISDFLTHMSAYESGKAYGEKTGGNIFDVYTEILSSLQELGNYWRQIGQKLLQYVMGYSKEKLEENYSNRQMPTI